MRGALTPSANCRRASARSTTRTCWTPPLKSFLNSFLSLLVISMCRAARAIPQVCARTFSIGIVFLENLQAVRDLGRQLREEQTSDVKNKLSFAECAPVPASFSYHRT